MKRKLPTAPATISDVARLAGVGKMTVSRVINQSGYVSNATEEKIRTAIAKLGYRPSEAARSLKGRRSRTVGIVVPDLADSFFAICANAAQLEAAKHGYMALITTSERDEAYEADEIHLMIERNIAGLIIVPTREEWSPLKELESLGVPIVAFDRSIVGLATDEVLVENFEGACQAVDHLIKHRNRRIACLGFDSNVFAIRERIRGYEHAMREAGLDITVHSDLVSEEAVLQLLQSWQGNKKAPSALFTLNNVTTLRTLSVIRKLGLSIPRDYALIGFDDLPFAMLLESPLTAVRQPVTEIGRRAASLLFNRILGGEASRSEGPVRLMLPVELVVRNSCGCGV